MSDWEIGDRVRVLSGPFEGFSGTVIGIESVPNAEVAVEIEIFGRRTLPGGQSHLATPVTTS